MKAEFNHARRPVPGVKDMVAVASGKGGVGKSTLSASLALALAGGGLRVGVLDADLYGPNLPGILGISGPAGMAADGTTLLPVEGHGLRLLSMGLLVERGVPVIWRGPMLAKMINRFLFQADWGPLDVLVLDLPPGTGDVQLTLTQTAPLSGAIIVTTPSPLALADVRRSIAMCRQTGTPIWGLVENMSTFVCHRCGHATPVFGTGGSQNLAAACGLPLLASIPLAPGLRQAADTGRIQAALSDAPEAQAIHHLAAAVRSRLQQGTA